MLAKDIIEVFSEEEDKILDPFFGEGSFVLACLEANRFIEGFELDPYTFDVFFSLNDKVKYRKVKNVF